MFGHAKNVHLIFILQAIKFYLDLPVKSVVENIKRYNWCDLLMIFVSILEPKKETNTYRYSQSIKTITWQTRFYRNKIKRRVHETYIWDHITIH